MDASVVSLITSRLDSIDRSISEERRDSAESRSRVYEKLEKQGQDLGLISSRVETLEKSINDMSPTVAEFVSYKTNVKVAGSLGQFLWKFGGWVLATASALAASYAWLQGFFTSGKP